MEKTVTRKYKIELPVDVVESISNNEIINLLTDKALTKAEYYLSKSKNMEERYGISFNDFKKKVEESKKEDFKEWDDLILWEGYVLGYKEWNIKYEELRFCRK